MKKRIFTLMMAFLAIAGNAVWGQSSITINNVPITTGGTGWEFQENTDDNNVLTISTAGTYTIKGTGTGSGNNTNIQIILSGQGKYNITFDNFRTDARLGEELQQDPVYDNRSALTINSGAIVTLSWTGINKFWSSPQCAGINVKDGAKLILKGKENDGYLEAGSLNNSDNKHTDGAGIGGDANDPNFGTIVIESGVVKARCESKTASEDARAAGIGGGYKENSPSTKGTIIIKGGKIEAACWSVEQQLDYESNKEGNEYAYGAGIGGGYKGTCTNIAILGGEVVANAYTEEPNKRGNDIGVGYQYSGGVTKGIIIGQWDENSPKPEINGSFNQINIANGLDYNSPSITGNVTMPGETQVYVPMGFSGELSNFNSYCIEFEQTSLDDDGDSHTSGGNVPKDLYYFGPNQSFVVNDLTCGEKHLFLGWYNDKDHLVASKDGSAIFMMPNEEPTGTKIEPYYSVWVDNKHEIAVATGTSWTENARITPKISYEPDYTDGPDVLSSLHFALSSYDGNTNQPEELKGLTFINNQLIGTPTLQGNDTYKKIEVKATVKLGDNGETKEISIPITIVEEKMINSVDVATKPHTYNGLPHNQRQEGTGTSEDYVLDVKMTKDIIGVPLPADDVVSLVEGVDYYISKVNYKNGDSEETLPATGEQSVPIINAGTYSSIEITALNATFDSDLTPIQTGKYSLPEGKVIVVAQRPMNISISFNKQSIEEDEELTWDDVTVTPQTLEGNSGIVAKDAEDFKKAVTGKINYTLNEEGTIATVEIFDVEVSDQGEFLVSNYDLTINGKPYTKEMEVDLDDPEVPVTSSSTGGSINNKRYQLFLANKDYLKTDEKTVEYYEDLKLELFSRHNKKYTDAGGSFTIWYEKDGEANVGGYRLFWSKSGEHGDYQEVKFDPVSEYFRIDNVHSDVYVKIYDADGFPVANEAITAQDFRAYAQPNKIIVITPEPTDVQIISMAGAVVAADKVTGQREFANLAEGVYIVRMGETIVKLQVRN